jgi:GT2 family glycosyltransferase
VRESAFSVAAALLNWNGWRDTVACLESLRALQYPDLDIILCDNASSDDSVDRIIQWALSRGIDCHVVDQQLAEHDGNAKWQEQPRLLIVRSPDNRGFAGGTNLALRHVLTSAKPYCYAWVLNTDTTVEPDSLAVAVRAMDAGIEIASVQSLLVWSRQPELLDSAGLRLLFRGGAKDILHHKPRTELSHIIGDRAVIEIFGCCGAAALYRVDVLRSIGLFDERLFQTHEDVDLACRLRAAGYRAVLATGSIVHHVGGVSRNRKKTGRSWWIAHRNKLWIVARWYPRLLGIPILVIGSFRALLAAVRSRDVALVMWLSLLQRLWTEWRTGASPGVRCRILRLGSAGLIV